MGQLSDLLSVQLTIVGEESGQDSEDEKAIDSQVGETYEHLLLERLKSQALDGNAGGVNNNAVLARAEIKDKVSRDGRVRVSFSKKMLVFSNYIISSAE